MEGGGAGRERGGLSNAVASLFVENGRKKKERKFRYSLCRLELKKRRAGGGGGGGEGGMRSQLRFQKVSRGYYGSRARCAE